jgi:hypothetical protein
MISSFKLRGGFLNVAAAVVVGISTVVALGAGSATVTKAGAGDKLSMQAAVAEALAKNEQSLIEFRRDLHRHPELSGQEVRTAMVIAERMRTAGLDVRTDVGGHGVVAVLKGGKPGPVVAYRADMDAIPTTGPDPVEFRLRPRYARGNCGGYGRGDGNGAR